MLRKVLQNIVVLALLLSLAPLAQAASLEMHSVAYPERRAVDLTFLPSPKAPAARLAASVMYRKGQAEIELEFNSMKPAILFGGDVTCYVVWAVTRDGQAENLGELLTRKMNGKLAFATGRKNFALLVTAEAYYLVKQPSGLVVFHSAPRLRQPDVSSAFTFDRFAPEPKSGGHSVAGIRWDSKVPLELLQARKAYELAGRFGAAEHAADIYHEAGAAMQDADKVALSAPKSRELLDTARRAVALSNEAINISVHRVAAIRAAEELATRRAETQALEARAAEAEAAAEEARRLTALAAEEATRIREEKQRMVAETSYLRNEKIALESSMGVLRTEKTALEAESLRLQQEKTALETEALRLKQEKTTLETEALRLKQEKTTLEQESLRLQQEKADLVALSSRLQAERDELGRGAERLREERDELTSRLQNALSHVADTRESARGLVVSLPDILFDVDEATLKPEARLALAKLAGILLVLPDQSAVIEGHTDSTGSAEYNLELSRRRANSVRALLHSQGLAGRRLQAVGYGIEQPVGDNATADGRRKNRRVEVIITEALSSD